MAKCEAGHKTAMKIGEECIICGRPLVTAESRARGAGPKCARKVGDSLEYMVTEAAGQMNMFDAKGEARGGSHD